MPSWLPAAKSAAITGAGGGIGRALCVALAKAGARSIVALDIDHEASKETAALCAAAHPGCAVRAERCDASDGEALRAALRRAEQSPSEPMPALAQKRSSGSARRSAARSASPSLASQRSARTAQLGCAALQSAAVSCDASRSMSSATIERAPAFASAQHSARPTPPPAPVTAADLARGSQAIGDSSFHTARP